MGHPRRRTRARRLLAGLVGLTVLLALVGVWQFRAHHPRDEVAYVAYLRQFPGAVEVGENGDVDAALAAASRFTTGPNALVAAGDHACTWLSQQPYAGLRSGPRFRVAALSDRYLRTSPTRGWTGYPDSFAVTAGAWAYLCPGTLDLHKPHWLFGAPTD